MSNATTQDDILSYRARFAVGALGALLPVLASLLTADLAGIIDHRNVLTIGIYIGYFARVVVLILLGGIIAALNEGIRQPLALVQIGIAAPALITSYINGASVAPAKAPQENAYNIISVADATDLGAGRDLVIAGGFFNDLLTGFTRSPSQVPAAPEKRHFTVRKAGSCTDVLSNDEAAVRRDFPPPVFTVEPGSC